MTHLSLVDYVTLACKDANSKLDVNVAKRVGADLEAEVWSYRVFF